MSVIFGQSCQLESTQKHKRRSESGFAYIWFLGLSILIMGIGAMAFSMWQLVDARRSLYGAVDAAVIAAAGSAIDEVALRNESRVILDVNEAELVAADYLARNGINAAHIEASPEAITVIAHQEVYNPLLAVLRSGGETVLITAQSYAEPRQSGR